MKKTIILLLLLLLPILTTAQSVLNSADITKMYPGSLFTFDKVSGKFFEVQSDTSGRLKTVLPTATHFGGTNGLKSITAVDSTSFSGSAVKFTISALDTIEYSYTRNFAVKGILFPKQNYTNEIILSVTTFPKIYYRSYGSAVSRQMFITYSSY